MDDSRVKYRLHYRRGARLAWTADKGPLVPGLHCGYAVTFFDDDLALRKELTHYKYSEVIKRNHWKVGTSEITAPRLDVMRKMKIAKTEDVWLPYDKPYEARASKYQGDCKADVAGHCEFMTKALIRYNLKGTLAFLMIPLIHAFDDGVEPLERHLSYMISKGGGYVLNDKNKPKEKKARLPRTKAKIDMPDGLIDKLLPLPPTLKKLGFLTHPKIPA